jgi:hypothetical protein
MRLAFCRGDRVSLLPAFAELGKSVGERHPLEPAAGARVVDRRHAVGLIEAAGGDVDLVPRALESNVSCVPHSGQKLRVPLALDLRRAGSPPTMRNCERGTLNHATNGAPVVRRQIEQWQLVWLNGAPPAS